MRLLLINPPRFNGIPVIREERCEITERNSIIPPYSLLQVGAELLAGGHEVHLVDANGENLTWEQLDARIKSFSYDVLIFRFTPTTLPWDLKTATLSKNHNPKAVTAGICWTMQTVPEVVLQSCPDLDVYIRHEYESVVPNLAAALSAGQDLSTVPGIAYWKGNEIALTEPAKPMADWDSLPLPAYQLLPSLDNYAINTQHGAPFTIIYGSKGCPFSCIYCTERNTKLKTRSAESILTELQYLKDTYDVKTVSFFDETFTIDRKRAIAIANSIKERKLGIVWYCNTRVNLVDAELLKVMHDGGCRGMSFGVESGSQKILDNAKKGITVQEAEAAIKLAKKAGIKVLCSFIFGLPGENWDTVHETINFVKRTLPTGAQFNVAVPYPGTELYRTALEKGWIKQGFSWTELYQHEAAMHTDELTAEELDQARKMAYHALYFSPKWWLQNTWHVAKEPSDLALASKYVVKIVKNYGLHKMTHAH
jgi:anaerobic magnesium-protoporphyrin IX monomethyl ester cyclase